ncbi:hypothetical protein [Brevundimonas sp. SL130]|uniref:hypothetical protein n=1 Tax=Brevundimonas sp. SL130 TaxID=2995143 RepID=UPI00226D0000|nr:hypothetical protein [Brevundimonas sp. SL130]WAC59616.1 hypothetical protein OU998_15580 [Brevundimonas sp. SL130]
MTIDEIVRLSFLRALYGRAHCELLSCSASVGEGAIAIRVVHMTGSPEIDDDIASIIAEMIADFPDLKLIDEIVPVTSYSEVTTLGALEIGLFLRPEPAVSAL